MGGRRQSAIERMLHSIEDRVEEWRGQRQARLEEVEAQRNSLFEEATERERHLAEAIEQEEGHSPESVAGEHRLVFVVHSREVGETLREASGGARLVNVVPGRSRNITEAGLEGSWLVIEPPEQRG